jgi:hypothetical protein
LPVGLLLEDSMSPSTDASKSPELKKLEERKLQLASQISELRAQARKLDLELHKAGADSVMIACW